jgi:hypothetical protein
MTFMLTKSSARFGTSCRALTSVLGLCAGVFFATFLAAQSVLAQSPPSSANTPNQTGQPTSGQTESASTSSTITLTEPRLIVIGDELPSAYGAPGAFSRSRFSAVTTAYVLPAWGVFAGLIYEGDVFPHGPMDNLFTQEIEVGLPYRFGIAVENQVEHFNHETVNASFSIEGRWALADWDKIPLNPTLFAEYKFGTGRILHEEGPPEEMMTDEDLTPEEEEMMMQEEEARMQADRPNAYEFRLLLSEEIVKGVGWAFNAFLENEIGGDRGREWGFAQAVQMPLFLPHERFTAGVEMQYKNFTVKDTRGDPESSFVIGPAFAYKPTARMRFDVSPLFGVTKDSPDVQIFGVFSYVFGGETSGAEAPASTRNR